MPLTNCTSNTSRQSLYGFSVAGSTTISKLIAADSWGIKSMDELTMDTGNNGTLWQRDVDYVRNKTKVDGAVKFTPRPTDFRWLLPLIFGGAFSGDSLKPSPLCPFFRAARYDRLLDRIYTAQDCVTSKAEFSSSDSGDGQLKCNWSIEACQRTRAAGSGWPSGLLLPTMQPFMHTSAALTVAGKVYRLKDISISVENNLILDEFYNARYRSDMPHDGQVIKVKHTSPFDDSTDEALFDATGVPASASVVYTSGLMSLTFTFYALVTSVADPEIGGKGSRVRNQIEWTAALDTVGSVKDTPVTITLDDTP